MKRPILQLFLILFVLVSCSSNSDDPETNIEDTIEPEVSISFPGVSQTALAGNIVVSNQLEININADDHSGIAKVEAFIDDVKVGEDTSAPYQIIIDVSTYESKIHTSYKDYLLTVTATDNSGNQTSIDQIINIDNELPVITAVSIEENSILGGDANVVTFEIEENQGLESVEIFINNQFEEALELDNNTFNIKTTKLEDGQNILKIVATDRAQNIAIYEVAFISDNSGPEITLENLVANQIIDGDIIIAPTLTDAHSDLFTLSIKHNEQALLAVENPENESYTFKPGQFETGEATITITAKDILLNTTILEIPVSILRRLVKINVSPLLFDTDEEAIAFISTKDGTLLDEAIIDRDGEEITLRTSLEPNELGKLMLTFAVNRAGAGVSRDFARFKTIADIDINLLSEINLNLRPMALDTPLQIYSADGFVEGDYDRFRSNGSRYGSYLGWQNLTQYNLKELGCFSCTEYNHDKYYLRLTDTETDGYLYYWLHTADLNQNFVLDRNDFSQEGIEQRHIQTTNLPAGSYSINFQVSGFINSEEFNGFYRHEMDTKSYRQWEFDQTIGMPYNFNSDFQFYYTQVKMPNYLLKSYGQPLESFEPLDWTVDWTIVDREINILKNSQGEILAEIELGQSFNDEN
ncbi:MAG: Ig-like domain-containing protein, partial [Bacteroidota bacterium]